MHSILSLAPCCLILAALCAPSHAQGEIRSLTCSSHEICQTQCSAGQAHACTSLAIMQQRGLNVRPDPGQAAALFEQACQQGSAWACLESGELALRGHMFAVERDRARFERDLDRAARLAEDGCNQGQGESCLTLAELHLRHLDREQWPESEVARRREPMLQAARKACGELEHLDACRWLERSSLALLRRQLLSAERAAEQWKTVEKQYGHLCRRGNDDACVLASGRARTPADIRALVEGPCTRGNALACLAQAESMAEVIATIQAPPAPEQMETHLRPFFDLIVRSCAGRGHDGCDELAELYLGNEAAALLGVTPDPQKAVALLLERCRWGWRESCATLGTYFIQGHEAAGIARDPALAREPLERQCLLTAPGDPCDACKHIPDSDVCLARAAWDAHQACTSGQYAACEIAAEHFRAGRGLEPSASKAAWYYRRACDASRKSSCAALHELCVSDPALGDTLCHQSLIHSDPFYEAEWRFRHSGVASLAGDEGSQPASTPRAVDDTGSAGQPGFELSRGSLNTDLVVSIVLSRARQAALRLVADELRRARRHKDLPRYVHDLLAQAALLLADRSTLRREKLQDLAMTVVRAFVARHLVATLFPADRDLVAALLKRASAGTPAPLEAASDADRAALRRYLTDWAYHLLATTDLFGRARGEAQAEVPPCPFPAEPLAAVCRRVLDDRGKPDIAWLTGLLKIDRVLQAIALARTLRSQGGVELRRFVEAIGTSRSIANLGSTPGLNLAQWESELVLGARAELGALQERVEALRFMLQGARELVVGANQGLHMDLGARAELARGLLETGVHHARLGSDAHRRALEMAQLLAQASGAGRGQLAATKLAAGNLTAPLGRDHIHALARLWDEALMGELEARIGALLTEIQSARATVAELDRIIGDIRAQMARLDRGKGSLDVGDLPLHELAELAEHFRHAAGALAGMDKHIHGLLPGASRTQVRFASSAVLRLLGFLDLMERVARTTRLGQTCGDIISALSLLGSMNGARFSAPLLDLLEPVLAMVNTHEPMSADLLFAMIARVRLDSLVTSLAEGAKQPCEADGRGAECWTLKVIHALQESVQRDGDLIRVDGGTFAQRLASHGDDFRRQHTWRGFFHFTVGFGGLYSQPLPVDSATPDMEIDRRVVPLVSEQIGVGLASPAFWRERLTFKTGVFASGILYRAVYDSTESSAIMAGPFFALDIYDLVELYAAPTLLFYPPAGSEDVSLRYGLSFGLTVPLGAYLERL